MWAVTEQNGKYVITDHNDEEQERLATGDGISTQDVKDVMRSRAADLKQDVVTAGRNRNVEKAIGIMTEWATIIEEMAGDQIQLPQPEE